jgi:hypothetical protein
VSDVRSGVVTGITLATLDGDNGYGLVADGALVWRAGVITYAGPRVDLATDARHGIEAHSFDGGVITPGLVDCHTHLVFAGNRAAEFEQRLQGASYEQIARAGGGILSTVRAVRAASEEALLAQSLPRAQALLRDGVTTLEIKSGYGLDFENERKMLRVARRIGETLGITVRTTYLAAHALPPEYAGAEPVDNADGYIDAIIEWLPRLHGEGLVDAVDAFCEGIGFSPAQTRRVFDAARALGLPVKLHADQLSDLGGAALAAEFGRPYRAHLGRRCAREGRWWHGRRVAAGCIPRAARHACTAYRGVAHAWRSDGGGHRLQSGNIAPVVVAPGDAAGVYAFPADTRGSTARRDRACGAGTGTGGSGRAARRDAGGFRALADRGSGGAVLLARRGTCRGGIRRWRTPHLSAATKSPAMRGLFKTCCSRNLLGGGLLGHDLLRRRLGHGLGCGLLHHWRGEGAGRFGRGVGTHVAIA